MHGQKYMDKNIWTKTEKMMNNDKQKKEKKKRKEEQEKGEKSRGL